MLRSTWAAQTGLGELFLKMKDKKLVGAITSRKWVRIGTTRWVGGHEWERKTNKAHFIYVPNGLNLLLLIHQYLSKVGSHENRHVVRLH